MNKLINEPMKEQMNKWRNILISQSIKKTVVKEGRVVGGWEEGREGGGRKTAQIKGREGEREEWRTGGKRGMKRGRRKGGREEGREECSLNLQQYLEESVCVVTTLLLPSFLHETVGVIV